MLISCAVICKTPAFSQRGSNVIYLLEKHLSILIKPIVLPVRENEETWGFPIKACKIYAVSHKTGKMYNKYKNDFYKNLLKL